MDGNQSGAEKNNRLLFREQYTLLFSKSKMAEVFFSQSGAEFRIQDGGRGSLSSSETWKLGFHRSLFWSEKIAHWTQRPGIDLLDSSDMSIENQSRHM